MWERSGGGPVTVTYGGSKVLAAQMTNGAPIDVFLSADTETVDALARAGTVDGSTKRVYAIGTLVLWFRRDSPQRPKRLEDLRDPAYRRIAIANPKLAPYGRAAQEALAAAGLSQAVAPRLVMAENIGEALQFARSGNADVALTALALVIHDPAGWYVPVPAALHRPIAQSAAVASHAANGVDARRFLDFVCGPQTAPLWKKWGYALPGKLAR